ncbi:MAG TPA: galactokinase, partial [Candidatus Dormibacteraeota bacterium]
PNRRRHVVSEIARVNDFVDALDNRDFDRLGRLLKESHISLRDDFEVSTPHVDALVEKAWTAPGCYGARIMGAGFGGSILALIRRGAAKALSAAVERPIIVCSTADGAYVRQRAGGGAP